MFQYRFTTVFVFLVMFFITQKTFSQFATQNLSLPQVRQGSVMVGDVENDGDLDILLTGTNDGTSGVSKIYRQSGTFSASDTVNANLIGVYQSSVAWGDYDNDGDLDILLTGTTNGTTAVSKIYRNNGNSTFTDINAGLVGVYYSSVAWGDYDNDGDLDILLTGYTGTLRTTKIYRNSGSDTFIDINIVLPNVYQSSVAFGDYDNDSDLDILLTGNSNTQTGISKIYRNTNGNFFASDTVNANLVGVYQSSTVWGDYDNDGDLDILLTGTTNGTNAVSKVYRNNGNNTFTDINAAITGVYQSSVVFADYDIDGDLDIILTGTTNGTTGLTQIYQNNSNVFTYIGNNGGLSTNVYQSSLALGRRSGFNIDIFLTGNNGGNSFSQLYTTTSAATNTAPSAPTNLFTSKENDTTFVFRWNRATDANQTGTANKGLTYNLYIGTSIATGNNQSPMSNILSGFRRVVQLGNTNHDTAWTLKFPSNQAYYWGVQAIDNCFVGGGFGATSIPIITAPVSTPAINVITTSFTANWSGTGQYKLDVAVDSLFTNFVSGYNNLDAGSNMGWNITLLQPNTYYYYRVRTYGSNWVSNNSATQKVLTLPSASTTFFVDSITTNQFRIRWNKSGNGNATYQIDITTDGFNTFIPGYNNKDVGSDTTILVTGLSLNTEYSIRVRTVNNTGTSIDSPVQSVTTLPYFSDISAGLSGVSYSSVTWGDYDNDGDLDILITGDNSGIEITKLYCNNGNSTFSEANGLGLTGVYAGSAIFGDYNSDSYLDILVSGFTSGPNFSAIYRNNGGTAFTNIAPGLPALSNSSFIFGDYDNDGDLDILVTGDNIAQIYRNDGNNIFTNINVGMIGISNSSSIFGDYDNDSDLDILLTGFDGNSRISKLYRNDGNEVFTDINAGLIGIENGSVVFGDYDNDGDLDILLTGYDGSSKISKIYKNTNGIFDTLNVSLPGVNYSSATWGDYDNDGNLDFIITGIPNNSGISISKIYRNSGNDTFTEIDAGLQGVSDGSVVFGDYDNDGDLDILLAGNSGAGSISKIYRNNLNNANTLPTPPTSLVATVISDTTLNFRWNRATDTNQPGAANRGLTYNLVVGTTPNGINNQSPMSNVTNGYRRIVQIGNANHDTTWTLKLTTGQTYYWGVQAIDNNFAGGAFAWDNTGIFLPVSLTNFTATSKNGTVMLNWSTSTEQNNYGFEIERKTSPVSPPYEGGDARGGWKKVGFVAGNGNSNEQQNYTFVDKNIIGGKNIYRLKQIDNDGKVSHSKEVEINFLPTIVQINQNFPNPFNPSTTINYQLPTNGFVTLKVYNILGEEVATLVNEEKEAGMYQVKFDGSKLSSGMYFYKLTAGKITEIKKMILLK